MRLQAFGVPHYWLISPEDKTLIAYQLENNAYRVAFAVECESSDCSQLMIQPFSDYVLDFGK